MRLVFLGTPSLAVPSLRALAAGPHELVGVVSQPDRPRGRGRQLEPTPVRAAATELGVPVISPEKVGADDVLAWLRDLAPDLGVVVAFGQFIPRSVRDLPRLGMINAHASLLPRHRGAAPIQAAVLEGDAETGVSVMRVVREMDAGAFCHQVVTPVDPDETAGELAERMGELAARALVEGIAMIDAGCAEWTEQDADAVTFAPKLDRSFGRLDWTAARAPLLRRLRAASPWPGCDIELAAAGRSLRIVRARSTPDADLPEGAPGQILARDGHLYVRAADGWVEVTQVQAPGKRAVASADFLRGARIADDERVVLHPVPERG